MKLGAVIVDNRPSVAAEAIKDHMKWLPGWELVHIKDVPIWNLNSYNRFMTNISFWHSLKFDRVLIFQHDSGILREGIEDFLEWDYVGAPWAFQEHGGNGGFSLRSPKVMEEILRAREWQPSLGYEDVFFSNEMHDRGLNLAPREACSEFSVEAVYQLGSLGFHAIDKWLSKDQCETIRNQYI